MASKTTVLLEQIHQEFYVRDHLDTDRVEQLSKLYKAGADIPPILLANEDGKLVLVYGRHRMKAREAAGFKEIQAIVRAFKNRAEMIVEAFKENVGGSLPPTENDIRRTLNLLLDQNLSRKAVMETVASQTGYPLEVLRRYMDDVQTLRAKQKMSKAITAISEDGLTVPQAAEKFGIETGKIRAALTGKKVGRESLSDISSGLSHRYRCHGHKNSALFQQIMRQIEEGRFGMTDLKRVFKHLRHLLRREATYVNDWEKRLTAALAK